jgi:hypothetical protein
MPDPGDAPLVTRGLSVRSATVWFLASWPHRAARVVYVRYVWLYDDREKAT